MRCHECESTKHFVADCPHRQVESANMTVHLTLVAGASGKISLGDTLGKGILDSACTKSVAGELWVKEFLDTMDESDKKRVETKELRQFRGSRRNLRGLPNHHWLQKYLRSLTLQIMQIW